MVKTLSGQQNSSFTGVGGYQFKLSQARPVQSYIENKS